jgi:Bacterial antitoxin of type II TA system, VapB
MKTTVEISDALLAAARKLAATRKTTVRALIEEGLRRVVEARNPSGRFKLADKSWGSGGLRTEFRGAPWEDIRDASYRGRGS